MYAVFVPGIARGGVVGRDAETPTKTDSLNARASLRRLQNVRCEPQISEVIGSAPIRTSLTSIGCKRPALWHRLTDTPVE